MRIVRRYSENGGTVSRTSSPTMSNSSGRPALMLCPVPPGQAVSVTDTAILPVPGARQTSLVCSAHMEHRAVTVTFPATPEYLRLARIATADAASRSGLDYEEIDDVRIAVSELCGLLSVDAAASITLAFIVEPGVLSVTGEAVTGPSE